MKITEMESLIYLKIQLKQQKLNSQIFTDIKMLYCRAGKPAELASIDVQLTANDAG